MKLLIDDEQRVAAYVCGHLKIEVPEQMSAFGVVEDDGALIGGVMFHDYRNGQVEGSWAFSHPKVAAYRGLWRILHHYCVNVLKVRRVSAKCAASNRRTQRLTEFLGFKKEGVARLGWSETEDAILYGIIADDWRM